MAFVVVLLVVLSLGIIDFGRMLMTVNVITHAARDGARQVALLNQNRWTGSPPAMSGADLTTVQTSVRAQIATVMPASQANAFTVTASRTPAGGVGDEASVTVTGSVPFLFSFPGVWGGSVNITRTATYRFEG
jgi:Flp pilus assembly protein TadG